MTMKAVAYFTILSFAAWFEGFAGDRVEHRVVRVRQTPGGPVTFVDDQRQDRGTAPGTGGNAG